MEFVTDAAARSRLPRLSAWLTPEQYRDVCRSYGESRESPVLPAQPAAPGVTSTTGKGLLARLRAAADWAGWRTSPID